MVEHAVKDNSYVTFLTFGYKIFKSLIAAEHGIDLHIVTGIVLMARVGFKNRV